MSVRKRINIDLWSEIKIKRTKKIEPIEVTMCCSPKFATTGLPPGSPNPVRARSQL